MAVSVIQHQSLFQNSNTCVLAFGSPNAAGNLLAYFTMADGSITAATDSNANTIANATSVQSGTINGGIRADYVASCNAGSNTVTGHKGSGGGCFLHIYEITGCDATAPLRDTGTVVSSATFSVSTSGTTSLSGDAVLGAVYDFPNNDTLTAGTGFSPSESVTDSANGDSSLSEFKVATTSGTQTATGGGNGTNVLNQLIVVFKQASGAAAVFIKNIFVKQAVNRASTY